MSGDNIPATIQDAEVQSDRNSIPSVADDNTKPDLVDGKQEIELAEKAKSPLSNDGGKAGDLQDADYTHTEKDKIPFLQNFRSSNIFSRVFFNYGTPMIEMMQKNNNNMKEDMIIEMTQDDKHDEELLQRFMANLERRD